MPLSQIDVARGKALMQAALPRAGQQPQRSQSMTKYLTPEQAAERLPFGNADWIRMQLRAGRLQGSKVAGRWLVEEPAIDEMVAAGSNSTARRRRRRAS